MLELTESGNGCRIRMQRRADRIWRGWNSHRVWQGLNASNARQGIKTSYKPELEKRRDQASERLQCPTGH